MSKPYDKQAERLSARRNGHGKADPGRKAPGSMNPHKPAAIGTGRRSRSKIQADSRQATNA